MSASGYTPRVPRVVKVGSLMMGGSWPVSLQTMWKTPLPAVSGPDDPRVGEMVSRIASLAALGCDALRFSVPDMDQAETLGALAAVSPIPLVADIHFDWRLALRCLDFPIPKIRVNPGNIGARWKIGEVVAKASDRGAAIRIGVNAGSLPADLRDTGDAAAACVEAAAREAAVFDELGFENVVVSMKLNQPADVERANRLFASRFDYPLHLGVTEAGPLIAGVARTAAALVPLLKDGIGSTLRVSLSDSMETEILAGREILGCLGGVGKGVRIVSCPRCGRAAFDTHAFLERWSTRLYSIPEPIEIAVMGCVVNGPGEARHADLGITGAGKEVLIFSRGQIVKRCPVEEADAAFAGALDALLVEFRA